MRYENVTVIEYILDLGRVLKIVLASVGTRNYETVVVEEFVVSCFGCFIFLHGMKSFWGHH